MSKALHLQVQYRMEEFILGGKHEEKYKYISFFLINETLKELSPAFPYCFLFTIVHLFPYRHNFMTLWEPRKSLLVLLHMLILMYNKEIIDKLYEILGGLSASAVSLKKLKAFFSYGLKDTVFKRKNDIFFFLSLSFLIITPD